MSDVKRAAHGVAAIFSGMTAQTIIRMVVIAILARYLSPADFGVVAAAMILINIVNIQGAFGVGNALIQIKDIEAKHVETALSLSVGWAVCLTALIYVGADAIAAFLSVPESADVLRWLSLGVFLRMISETPRAMLNRELRFRTIAVINLLSYILGYACVGVTMALSGHGYWALVAADITTAGAAGLLCTLASRMPWRFSMHQGSARRLLRFGGHVTGASLLRQVAYHFDQFIIARSFGPAELGFYSRGQNTAFRPINALGLSIESVLYPLITPLQNDAQRLQGVFVRGFTIYAIFVLPIVGLVAILADEVILLLLGEGWERAALFVQLLALGMLCRTVTRLCGTVMKCRGKTGWIVLLEMEYAIVAGTFILVGSLFGMEGLAVGVSLAMLIHLLIFISMVFVELKGGWERLGRSALGAAPLAIVPLLTAAGAHGMWTSIFDAPVIVTLGVISLVFALSWAAVFLFVPTRVVGSDGVWVYNRISDLVPSRTPFADAIRNRVARVT